MAESTREQALPPLSQKWGVALLVAPLLVSAWSMVNFIGPFRWLADLQMHLFGAYRPLLTLFATMMLAIAPVLAAVYLARKAHLVPAFMLAGSAPQPAEANNEHVPALPPSEVSRLLFEKFQRRFVLPIVGVLFLWLGVRESRTAEQSQMLEKLSVAQLEEGVRPTSAWIELTGVLLTDLAVQEGRSNAPRTYIPMVSPGWTKAQPFAAVVRVEGTGLSGGNKPGQLRSARGMVDANVVPAPVRETWKDGGLIGGDATVLELGADPSKAADRGKWGVRAGLAILAWFAASMGWTWWRSVSIGLSHGHRAIYEQTA